MWPPCFAIIGLAKDQERPAPFGAGLEIYLNLITSHAIIFSSSISILIFFNFNFHHLLTYCIIQDYVYTRNNDFLVLGIKIGALSAPIMNCIYSLLDYSCTTFWTVSWFSVPVCSKNNVTFRTTVGSCIFRR